MKHHAALTLLISLATLPLAAQQVEPSLTPDTADAPKTELQQPANRIRRTNLKDSDVTAAILLGQANRDGKAGLKLTDVGRAIGNAVMMLGARRPSDVTATSGFSLQVYTPLAWIQQQAIDAAKEFRSFGPSDVTEDMLLPVLRVVVNPDAPTNVGKHDTRVANLGVSVQHVVVRDAAKKRVLQPLTKDGFGQEAPNATGAVYSHEGIVATFDLEDLIALISQRGMEEFFITVVGSGHGHGNDKDFKVKRKHLKSLPGLGAIPE